MPKSALPQHLQHRKHEDYAWPFSLIPRAWTSYKLYGPPVLLWGNQKNFIPTLPFRGPFEGMFMEASNYTSFDAPMLLPTLAPGPVPDPIITGKQFVWGVYGVRLFRWLPYLPLGIAFTWKRGKDKIHGRLGVRWDDVDHYYTIPTINFQIRKGRYEA